MCLDSFLFLSFHFGTHIWVPQGVWECVIDGGVKVHGQNGLVQDKPKKFETLKLLVGFMNFEKMPK